MMPNLINLLFLCLRFLNQLIICGVFLHWFDSFFAANVEIMLLSVLFCEFALGDVCKVLFVLF